MRACQRCRKTAKQNFELDLKKWHTTTREKSVRTGRNDGYDEKWSRYQPKQRLNVDQSPLPFVIGTSRRYDHLDKDVDQHGHKVWISQPGSGLDKRQCTLQICFRPTGEQQAWCYLPWNWKTHKPRWKGSLPDVDVYYQESAWVDTKVSVEWVQKTLSPSVKDNARLSFSVTI